MKLKTRSNFHYGNRRSFRAYKPGDDFYEELIQIHKGLNDQQSARVNARLILLLANHIGEVEVLQEAMAIARNVHPG